MAYVNGAAIYTAIGEVLEGVIAGVRAIPTGEMDTDLTGGLMPHGEAIRAMVRPRIEVTCRLSRHPETSHQPSNLMLYVLEVELRRIYKLDSPVLPDELQAVLATLMVDSDQITQAFSWPGKLTTTSASVATGILSGVLRLDEETAPLSKYDDAASGPVAEVTQTFTGVVQVAPAIT